MVSVFIHSISNCKLPISATLIDYIVTNDKHIVHEVSSNPPKISDHSILSVNFNFKLEKNRDIFVFKRKVQGVSL